MKVIPSNWVRPGFVVVGNKLPVGSSLERVIPVGVARNGEEDYFQTLTKIMVGVGMMNWGDVHLAPEDYGLLREKSPQAFADIPAVEEVDDSQRFVCERCQAEMPDGYCVKCNEQKGEKPNDIQHESREPGGNT